MKRCATLCTVGLFAFLLSAQDSPRGEGHGGFEPRLGMMSMGPGSRTPVTGAPYSAVQVTETQQALGDGNQIARQEQSKVFRDSQGRVRMEHAAKGAQASAVIAIFDPVAGFTHVLHPSTMTAVKTPVHVHTRGAEWSRGAPQAEHVRCANRGFGNADGQRFGGDRNANHPDHPRRGDRESASHSDCS